MMTKRRRRFTADFKKRVALEALRGDRTVQAIAAKHEVHPNQVGTWKRQAVEGLDEVFARGGSPGPSEHEATIRDLHAKIGELTMEPLAKLPGDWGWAQSSALLVNTIALDRRLDILSGEPAARRR